MEEQCKFRLELVTNLIHNFIYSIKTLPRDPQHVSSIAVLIFRRTVCIFTVSGIVTLYMLPSSVPTNSGLQTAISRYTGWQHIECDDARYCKYTNCPPEDEHSNARNMLRITM
jgi:hypothetical protein